jgi:uncharacterized membrane protein
MVPEQSERQAWSEKKVELVVGNLLRTGVILAAVVVSIGGALYLVKYGTTTPHYETFHGVPADLRSPSGIVADAIALRPRGIIALGLLLLIATPVARVAFTIFAFFMEKDATYVGVTVVVLAVLLFSLFFSNRL